MLREIINRLRGQVRLRVRCPYPERVLNVCSARNLATDVAKITDIAMTETGYAANAIRIMAAN